MSIARSK